MLGQAVDLGGGVFKKRLGKNRFRSIILAKGGRNWVYEYLFAKEDLDNISVSDLANFRKLARSYEGLTDREIVELSANQDWVEIFE
ncbi:MAG: type II toxin-antitoxin system RelE/ParE family toxin [Terracidiphilus sp.]